jgi:hypothetical protein
MKDVLIKGMDMPKGCGECPLFDDECFSLYKCCRASSWGSDTARASDCPLVEIPTPHGDLIDRDVYITMLEQMAEDSNSELTKHMVEVIRETLLMMPIVVE